MAYPAPENKADDDTEHSPNYQESTDTFGRRMIHTKL